MLSSYFLCLFSTISPSFPSSSSTILCLTWCLLLFRSTFSTFWGSHSARAAISATLVFPIYSSILVAFNNLGVRWSVWKLWVYFQFGCRCPCHMTVGGRLVWGAYALSFQCNEQHNDNRGCCVRILTVRNLPGQSSKPVFKSTYTPVTESPGLIQTFFQALEPSPHAVGCPTDTRNGTHPETNLSFIPQMSCHLLSFLHQSQVFIHQLEPNICSSYIPLSIIPACRHSPRAAYAISSTYFMSLGPLSHCLTFFLKKNTRLPLLFQPSTLSS